MRAERETENRKIVMENEITERKKNGLRIVSRQNGRDEWIENAIEKQMKQN